ncbi:TKL/LISK/LISK-DD1 protein kinase [Mycena indigotica]|uniref:TKL/LISK/LISK-DD1 protein kinase n=1 Tax=Mycena indigotica TaxID=2126181 RepID=A0A8H6SD10_9AGAR|nr:TKL/LISK/LISK-DD1 protein kinase [Mycena indigotica]KAF7297184.1 TKL/LISK/LISK-DD1 protein kinase [Mycena indigotica]
MPLKFIRRFERRGSDPVLQLAVSLTALTRDLADMACFPPAAAVVGVVLLMLDTVQTIQVNKEGCHRLARRCARILLDINDQMLGRWDTAPSSLVKNLSRLEETVEAIHKFMKQAASASWKKRFLHKTEIETALANYHENLDDAARAFQMASLIEIHYAVGAKTTTTREAQPSPMPTQLPIPTVQSPELSSQSPSQTKSAELYVVDEEIYSAQVLEEQGFKRYHQSDIVLQGRVASHEATDGWWSGTSEARVNGSTHTSLIKRYEGPRALAREEWTRDIKTLQKLYHPNLPQLMGYSTEEAPTPFILLSNVRTRSPEAFLLGSLRRDGVAICIEHMLRFYSDVVNATLYLKDQLQLSEEAAQDFLENSSYRVDAFNNVVVGLPIQDRAVVTYRSYRLNESLRSVILRMLPNQGIVRYRQDNAVVKEDPTWQLTQLTALVSSLLPGPAQPPGLSSQLQQTIRSNDLAELAPTLRQFRQLSLDSDSHGYMWNKNSSIPAHKFTVGDLGYVPTGKDWDEFVRLGNLYTDGLANFPLQSNAYGTQWCWKDRPMQRSALQSFNPSQGVECWPVAVPLGAQMDCEIVHELRLVRMECGWEFLLDKAVELGKKWDISPESLVLITQAGMSQSFAINDFGGNLQQNMRNNLNRFPTAGRGNHFLPGQRPSIPKVNYLFTADRSDFEPYWSHQPVFTPQPPVLDRGWTGRMGWRTGFINWAQLHEEDFVHTDPATAIELDPFTSARRASSLGVEMHSDAFDVIPYADIKGEWKKLGAGSFGNVYKGNYLGIDVAIKEVLPSNEYDVAKYFEREWRLMKETRHPNCCLYIGLSRAPEPDNRIYIISEFIENGNLRVYIHDKSKPFPWRLRLSFATDITRALAYLHARKCIHRDLKGENLLVTSNGRLKLTDFGFARIAARNDDEMKRLTFCGTDSYMSPEILMGDEFDLPTDIFSLGIIFCEISARRLADDDHFKRYAPTFGIDAAEVHKLASPGCPPEFLALALDCLAVDPKARPTTRQVLERLRAIEAEVLARPNEGEELHVGSVRLMTNSKRTGAGPRMPSFGVGVGKDIRPSTLKHKSSDSVSTTDDSDDELMEAVMGLSSVGVGSEWSEGTNGHQPLLENNPSTISDYSTTVIRAHPGQGSSSQLPSLSSILTVRASPDPNETPVAVLPSDPLAGSIMSIASLDSYHTAHSVSAISTTYATEGGSTIRSLHGNYTAPLVHRFTLIKPGAKPKKTGSNGSISPSSSGGNEASGWNPLELFFSSGLLVSKCDICLKRLGWKPILECDDCGLRAHIKCGEVAPRDCGVRPSRPGFHQSPLSALSSPLSKVKHSAATAAGRPKSTSPQR